MSAPSKEEWNDRPKVSTDLSSGFQTMNLTGPSPQNLREWSQDVSKRLGLGTDFIHSLKDEDDWSFVIKANALLEAALTHALVKRLGEDKLQTVFAKMGQRQRIRWAADLELLGKDERIYADNLNWLRNEVVHDVTNVDLDLVQYFKDLDASKRDSFLSSCSFGFKPHVTPDLIARVWLNNPMLIVWIALHYAIAPLYDFLPSKVDISVTPSTADLVIHAYPPTVSTSPAQESNDK